MAEHPSLQALKRAELAYRSGAPRDAYAMAEAAWEMTREHGGASPQLAGQALSWYGFLKARVEGDLRGGLKMVQNAADTLFWDPTVFYHLADLTLRAGRRDEATRAIARGLRVAPGDPDLLRLHRLIGVRKPPVFSFLSRSNVINRVAGQLRHRWAPVPPRKNGSPTARTSQPGR